MGSLQCESITKIMHTWVCIVIANDMEELDLLVKLLPHGSFNMPNKNRLFNQLSLNLRIQIVSNWTIFLNHIPV